LATKKAQKNKAPMRPFSWGKPGKSKPKAK
jgi:hypothetical protein